MNFSQLVYFIETIQCGSINKAARKLNTNGSTILAGLNSLENELGFSILVRSKNGVQTTNEGKAFFEDCTRILTMRDNWKFLKYGTAKKEEIPVHVIPSVYHSIFSNIICQFTQEENNAVLKVKEKNTFEIENELSEKKFSIAVSGYIKEDISYIHSLADGFDYQVEIIGEDTYHVLVSNAHPLAKKRKLALEDLKEYAVVDSYNKTNFKFGLQHIYISLKNAYVNEKNFQIDLISQSLGLGLMPSIIKYNNTVILNKMKLLPLKGDYSNLLYLLIYPKEEKMTEAEQKLVEIIKNCFKKIFP